MKTAVILFPESPSFLRHAGEINALISGSGFLSQVELWLFYSEKAPDAIPEMACPVAEIRCLKVDLIDLPEYCLEALKRCIGQFPVDLMIFPGDGRGEELATRLAFRCGGSSSLLVEALRATQQGIEIRKPAYGNNLSARLHLERSPYCIAAARTAAPAAGVTEFTAAKENRMVFETPSCHWIIDRNIIPGETAAGLDTADIVLVVGQGAKNKETIGFMQQVADAMGAQLAGSRQAVMNAWIPMNRLLGVSGRSIASKLCIVAGVSGSGVFTAGIQNCECIIAINTDTDAPIFNVAHVGVVGDLRQVLAALLERIREHRSKGNRKRVSPRPAKNSNDSAD